MGNKVKNINIGGGVTNPDSVLKVEPVAKPEKKSFVRVDIRANKPYGIIRNRQEQMDRLFNA